MRIVMTILKIIKNGQKMCCLVSSAIHNTARKINIFFYLCNLLTFDFPVLNYYRSLCLIWTLLYPCCLWAFYAKHSVLEYFVQIAYVIVCTVITLQTDNNNHSIALPKISQIRVMPFIVYSDSEYITHILLYCLNHR